jgi:uncharacterized membrane protein
MNLVAIIILILGIIVALLSVPLVRGKVPPNAVYGIRTRLAFASEANWYKINKFGGKVFLGVAVIIALVGLIGLFLPNESINTYGIVAACISFVSVLNATLVIVIGSADVKK